MKIFIERNNGSLRALPSHSSSARHLRAPFIKTMTSSLRVETFSCIINICEILPSSRKYLRRRGGGAIRLQLQRQPLSSSLRTDALALILFLVIVPRPIARSAECHWTLRRKRTRELDVLPPALSIVHLRLSHSLSLFLSLSLTFLHCVHIRACVHALIRLLTLPL